MAGHVVIHLTTAPDRQPGPAPSGPSAVAELASSGNTLPAGTLPEDTLMALGANTGAAPSFDEMMRRLEALEGCSIEMDGSFAWRGPTADAWQVFGQVNDGRGGVSWVELRGRCPVTAWGRLLAILGAPQVPLQFQRLPDGTFADPQEIADSFAQGVVER